jgi:hypothetical protein
MAEAATMTHVERMAACQRLHGLFVDAHDDGVFGRVPVESADSRDFGSKVRIGGVEPVANTVRTQAPRPQNASDSTAADSFTAARVESVGDRLVRPHIAKGHAAIDRALTCQLNDLASGLHRHQRGTPGSRGIHQRLDARARLPSGSPLTHDAVAAPDKQRDPRRAMTIRKPHNDPCSDHDVMPGVPPPRERLHSRPFESRDTYSSRLPSGTHVPSIHQGRLSFP